MLFIFLSKINLLMNCTKVNAFLQNIMKHAAEFYNCIFTDASFIT